MIVESGKYESLLRANGSGAFGNVEYTDDGLVVLRTGDVKTTDVSGAVRLYFNPQRDQILSGHRYDQMGSGLILMRPGAFYRVTSTLEVTEPIPEGVTALPVLLPDIEDVMTITTGPLREGFIGRVCFTVQPYRKVEAEKLTAFAGLMFFEDVSLEWRDWVHDSLEDLRKRRSTGAKKSTKGAKDTEG